MQDGFYQHFQATDHLPLSSIVELLQQHKILHGIEPTSAGSRSKYANANQCAMLPPYSTNFDVGKKSVSLPTRIRLVNDFTIAEKHICIRVYKLVSIHWIGDPANSDEN